MLFKQTNDSRLCDAPVDDGDEFSMAFKAATDAGMAAHPCLGRGCNDLQDSGNKRGLCFDCFQRHLDIVDAARAE